MKFSGKRLRCAREQAKLSLERLSRAVEAKHGIALTKQTYLYYEQGATTPNADTLAAICAVLDCNLNDLFLCTPVQGATVDA